jgi:hypothetical protein
LLKDVFNLVVRVFSLNSAIVEDSLLKDRITLGGSSHYLLDPVGCALSL